jgi:pimeloyl-ACP methyl ester carboxylesterase
MKKIKDFLLVKSVGLYINALSYINAEKAKVIAYNLFSQPHKGKIKKEKLPKTLLIPAFETFEYQNESIQTYIWKGNHEVIFLAHGWESNSSRWKKLLPYLKLLGKTIIAIDAPAHGLTSGKEFNAPKYAEYINVVAQKYPPKYIIGHSIGGGAISFYLHLFNNSIVEKVVLLGSPSDFQIINNNYVALLGLNNKVKKLLEEYYTERFGIPFEEAKGHYFAKNFTQKAIIAHDIDDDIVRVVEGQKYASTWKNSEYIETKGLGHSMHDAVLYERISKFLMS